MKLSILWFSVSIIPIFSLIDKTDFPTDAWIERVVILGPPAQINKAKLISKSKLGYFFLIVF